MLNQASVLAEAPVSGRARVARRPPIWLQLPVLLVGIVAALPLLFVIVRTWESGWQSAWRLLWRPFVGGLLVNTLMLLVLVTALCAVIGLALAWCMERSDLRGRRYWNVLLCLPFAIPAFVSSFTWISIGPEFEGLGGAVMIMTLSKYPVVYLPVAAALRSLDASLEESARMLGYDRRTAFWRVTFPLLKPTLLGTSLLVALHMLIEFAALSILRFQTFTTAIYQQFELEFSSTQAAMLSAVLLAMCLVLLWMEIRLRGRGFARIGQGVARKPASVSLGRWQWVVQAMLLALVTVGCVIPLVMLGYWVAEGTSASFPLARIGETLGASLYLSLGGALLSCALALPVGFVVVRYKGRFAQAAERLPYLLQAVPGLVVALSLVFVALSYVPALYQTTLLLLVAYALLFMPMAQAPIRTALEKASPQLEEAARTLGCKPLTAFLKVTLPIVFPAIAAGFVLVFLDTLKELTATLVLGPTGLDTLATAFWSHTTVLEYAAAAPYAALIVLVSGLPVYLMTARKVRRRLD
ncbi:ABC transporter permease [Pseudomonas matsuisoli]|uniref:Iron (III)-transporter permease HitB n=1 Tax=Pseudomonas matsuisoli TaxID=1515666 RepID=A0A917PHX8_9PSED|nr:iron ABC transporter permease [Pseudomonas matsuisoli]GGJ79637.1 iron (III)-transporter permease HitB [Pseudomonas matsuisoli]